MNRLFIIVPIVVVALLVIVVLSGTFYIVDEGRQVVITQFGRIIGEPITEPGLHTKLPFVQTANYFEKRLLDWEGDRTVIKTVEQKFISIEVFARWRITDPKLYLQTVAGRFEVASSRLDAIIDPIVRDVMANFELRELVRSDTERVIYERVLRGTTEAGEALPAEIDFSGASGALTAEQLEALAVSAAEEAEGGAEQEAPDIFQDLARQERELFELRAWRIENGRNYITREVFERAGTQVERFGIELVDVRILRINYLPETRQQVFNRMIADRQRVTARYISEGQQRSAELRGTKDRLVREIQSLAQEQELLILGEGEAQSIQIYADAYNQDSEFYRFYKTLETLRTTMDADTWLILSTDSEFYSILQRLEVRR